MRRKKEFEDILDACLERIFRGESLDACLKSYPGHAAELEPLLQTAIRAKTATSLSPRPEFREAAARRFQEAIRGVGTGEKRGWSGWFPRWAVAITAVVIVLLAGSGTVWAASSSLPGSPLYPIKLATEEARVMLTFSDTGKAELYASFADKRIEEITRMAEEGKVDGVEMATEQLSARLVAVADLFAEAEENEPVAILAIPQATEALPALVMPVAPSANTTLPEDHASVSPETVPSPAPAPQPFARNRAEKGAASPAVDREQKAAKQGRLKEMFLQRAHENEAKLRSLLERSDEAIRPSVLKAIEAARQGYQQAISGLEPEK